MSNFPNFVARLIVFGLVVAGLTFGAGLILPRQRTATSNSTIMAPPEFVFALLTDVEGQREWRSDLRTLTVDPNDATAWTEQKPWGFSTASFRFQQVEKVAPSKYELTFESSDGFRGKWLVTLTADDAGRTNLSLTQTVEIDNAFRRVWSHLTVNLQEGVERYLVDLTSTISKRFDDADSEPSSTATPPAKQPTGTRGSGAPAATLTATGPIRAGSLPTATPVASPTASTTGSR